MWSLTLKFDLFSTLFQVKLSHLCLQRQWVEPTTPWCLSLCSWTLQFLGDPASSFLFFSVFYMASLMGNLLVVFSVSADASLHSPMYFLLANLSFLDMGFCSPTTTPKMIYDLFRKCKAISFGGCLTQIFFIHAIGGTEMSRQLLIAMAFDRYVAICKPLHYLTIMNPRMCVLILAAALSLASSTQWPNWLLS